MERTIQLQIKMSIKAWYIVSSNMFWFCLNVNSRYFN